MKSCYFVSYAHSKGFGSLTVDTKFKVKSKDAFGALSERVANALKKSDGLESIAIINFFRL